MASITYHNTIACNIYCLSCNILDISSMFINKNREITVEEVKNEVQEKIDKFIEYMGLAEEIYSSLDDEGKAEAEDLLDMLEASRKKEKCT